jgi:hypothetical protein
LTALATSALKVTQTLRELGRAVEDADDTIQDALADRDGADDDLDSAAQEARAALGGRSADAVKNTPYTSIFPDGISYYTAAPLDEEEQRYGELKDRLGEHLPGTDAVRKKTSKAIDHGLADWKAAADELKKARTAESLSATKLATATEAWTRQMEKTYGALVGEVGKAKAEAFFPQVRGKRSTPADPTAPPDVGSPGPAPTS